MDDNGPRALIAIADPGQPMHVGALLGNSPAMLRSMAAAAFGGYVPCGINTTRRGDGLAADIGKPLALVLATPEQPDDADNILRAAFGNEATERDIDEFARRFGCRVVDSFGSSEFAVVVMREDGTPPGSIGRGYPGVSVYHAETVTKCAPAVFDEHGALANVDEAVGELVNTYGVGGFTGYYNDQGATEERMRHGMYWSGDLAYRDAEGWIYKTLKRTLIAEGGGGRCVVGAGGAGAQLCRRERMMLVGHV